MSSRVPLTSGKRLLTQASRAEASHRPVAGKEVTATLVELAFVPRTLLDMKWTGKNALDPDLEAFVNAEAHISCVTLGEFLCHSGPVSPPAK